MWDYIFYLLVHFRFGEKKKPNTKQLAHQKTTHQETSMAKIKTVGDLIDILEKYPKNTPIAIYNSYNAFEIESVIDYESCALINSGKTNNALIEETNKKA